MTLTDAVVEPKNKAVVNSGTLEIYGGSYKTVDQNCIVNNGGLVTIDKGTATEGLLEAEGASCIKNNWGRVTIKGGTITSDAETAVENNGGLRSQPPRERPFCLQIYPAMPRSPAAVSSTASTVSGCRTSANLR